ncbi:Necrosis inducing protein (NPP1) [Spirosomataceae bacterium TFI 002]|nr:Necrosis inducing protein (NPP1) [Spirosomataceae bacterium TFI 002]
MVGAGKCGKLNSKIEYAHFLYQSNSVNNYKMLKPILLFVLTSLLMCDKVDEPQNFKGLPENASEKVKKWAVVFDFDRYACYPSAAISPDGRKNEGLAPKGLRTGNCREIVQLENANTFCRTQSITRDNVTYEVIMYALYFEKDQYMPWSPFELKGSHRHDWEYASVWLQDGRLTHATYSAHSRDGESLPTSTLHFDSGMENHVKVVYHQDGVSTHCMRFAKENEKAQNELGKWITPKLVEWDLMSKEQQSLMSGSWGKAHPPFIDKNFYREIEKYVPPGYPLRAEWEAK